MGRAQLGVVRRGRLRAGRGRRDGESRDDQRGAARDHLVGAGRLVFQMSRRIFQRPPTRFQTTTYLPRSTTVPSAPLISYRPDSEASSPAAVTSTVVSFAALMPASITPCQSFWMAGAPATMSLLGGKAWA